MSSRPFDSYHDSLISQYRELIHEAFIESEMEHKSHLNYDMLEEKLHSIIQAATLDGISTLEVQELLVESQRYLKKQVRVI